MGNGLDELIEALAVTTAEMRQAALRDDWPGVARIQRRRLSLAERLLKAIEGGAGSTAAQAQRLADVRREEREVMDQASAHRQQLGESLTEARSQTRKKQVHRIRRAYDL